jgi:hypothetical protein
MVTGLFNIALELYSRREKRQENIDLPKGKADRPIISPGFNMTP